MRRFLLLALSPMAALAADDFKLNAQEYFERAGINVMLGQDYYPEGHQGGLSIIMHDERVASNGDVRLEPSPGQWAPIPKPVNPIRCCGFRRRSSIRAFSPTSPMT